MACYKVIVLSVVINAFGIWLLIHNNRTTGMEDYEDEYIELDLNASSIKKNS